MLYFIFNWKSYKLNEWNLKLLVLSNRNKPLYSYFVMIQLLLILMTNAGRLKDRKKKKQTNKQREK